MQSLGRCPNTMHHLAVKGHQETNKISTVQHPHHAHIIHP